MASKKSKILAIAFCAAVMAGIHVNPVLAAWGDQDFSYQEGTVTTETGTELNNPEIHHTVDKGYMDDNGTPWYPIDDKYVSDWQPVHPEGDVNCEEEVANSNITVGDMNKVTADLVENDEKINKKVDKVASDVKNLQEQVNKIETTTDTDTHVKEETYKADENGNVTMDVVDKNGDPVKDESGNDKKVVIEDVASKEKLDETTATANDAYSKAEQALSENEAQDEILDEHGKEITAVKEKNEAQDEILDEHGKEITAVKEKNEAQDEILDEHGKEITAVKEKNEAQDEILDEHGKEITAVKEKNEQQDSRLDNHEAVIGVTDKTGLESAYEGATYIDKNDTMVEADRKLDAAISDVNSRVDRLDDRIDKVGAMSAAIANLRTMGYDPAAPTEVAVGVGQYRDETGMALGLFHYPNRDFMLSLSVSTSGDEYMGGIGATWKFGRKSPEKVAEIKKAQAEADARRAEEQKLAKAEEMKKAAKEAKVQAQMERHAKMLAEQEAQA